MDPFGVSIRWEVYKRILTYRDIFVALDGSAESYRALDHAVAIDEKFGAELILLSVVSRAMIPPTTDPTKFHSALYAAQYRENVWRHYQNVLTEAEYKVSSEHPDLKMEKILREGRPSAIIVEMSEREAVDLIVMGSRGIGGITGWILGSTSHGVVDSCSKPVLIV